MFDPALSSKTLILAGGGHSHALLLRLWTMRPKLRPDQAITLVSSHGSTLYSGMVPSLIAGLVTRQQATINLRWLAQQAGVAFIQANVRGIDRQGSLQLLDRPELRFGFLSLNLGGHTRRQEYRNAIAIKPLEPALRAISAQDALSDKPNSDPFHCVGAGLAAVEVVLALRQRWARRPLVLHTGGRPIHPSMEHQLTRAQIQLSDTLAPDDTNTLLCTGRSTPMAGGKRIYLRYQWPRTDTSHSASP